MFITIIPYLRKNSTNSDYNYISMKNLFYIKFKIQQEQFQNNSFSPTGDLLSLVDADFAALSLDNKVRAIGRMEPFDEASSVISYLQSCRIDRITSTHCVRNDFPKLVRAHRIQAICGILIVPLNVGKENDFLVFFRKGQIRHVNWAG